MSTLRLVFPSEEYEREWIAVTKEFEESKEKITPAALKNKVSDYNEFLDKAKKISLGVGLPSYMVPSDIYFLVNEENRILGSIDIRHFLNEHLRNYGGHIGYGIRPSERRKGYATEMLRLALKICKEKQMDKVLITCDKTNEASARTIKNNGGILENEVMNVDILIQRYWIEI